MDQVGLYQPSDLKEKLISWNPRLFGYATTDKHGRVTVQTIRPAHYHAHYDAEEPAHIHFTATHPGYRTWGGEIFFTDDPRVTPEVRAESQRVGTPIMNLIRDANGALEAEVQIVLQQE
ncbi:MAG: hypothetical protein ACPG31_12500 [Planctomycetota bacterium]